MVLIKDILHKEVVSVKASENVLTAVESMCTKGISCLVVVSEKKVIGIITRKDILEKVVMKQKNPAEIKIEDVMSSPVKTIMPDKNLLHASAMMNSLLIKQLPVVEGDKLVGIVTQTDIVRNLNKFLGSGRHLNKN